MKFFRAVAPRWYGHANDATLALSALLILAYVSLELVFTNVKAEIDLSIPIATFVLAIVAVIYSLGLFKFVTKKSFIFAGLISYLLLSASFASLIVGTGGLESQYVALWMIPAILSYMFGMPVLVLTWLATNAYLVVEALGIIGNDTDLALILLYFITLQLPFMVSYMIWRRSAATESSSEDSTLFTDSDLSADLLIESIAEGVIVVDLQEKVQLFNKAAESITGWDKADALGLNYHSVFKLVDGEDQPVEKSKDPIGIVLVSNKPTVSNELSLKTHSDKTLEVTLVISPIEDHEGSAKAVAVVFRDVSEERSQQRQRAEFISTASHEMRTPVAAIEGYIALTLNDKVSKIDSAAKGYLEKAQASTQHLGKLFQDLLTAAKSEDGRLTNNPVVTDMLAFMEQVIEDMRFAAEKKGLQVVQSFGAGAGRIGTPSMNPIYLANIDPERMREVLTNLFDNAVKYTEEGMITIGFTGTQDKMTISITDTGAGIPPEDVSHLFQKFYRVDNSATQQIGGTGLGLFISKKIVEMYHGRIWAESTLGEGSTFFIELPRLDQAHADQLKQLESVQRTPIPTIQEPTSSQT